MKKIIEVNIVDEDDLFEKYNKKVASRELINYLVEAMPFFKKKDIIKIVIKNNLEDDVEIAEVVKRALREEYEDLKYHYNQNNLVQVLYFFIGIIVLFISTKIFDEVFKEMVIILGWVLMCSMIESEIYVDFGMKKRIRKVRKLLSSEIIEMKDKEL